MLLRRRAQLKESEVTDEALYLGRRQFLRTAGLLGAVAASGALPGCLQAADASAGDDEPDKLTPYDDVTTYNNYYEFGTGKDEPAKRAGGLRTKPWSIAVEGLVARPATYELEDILKPHRLEEATAADVS